MGDRAVNHGTGALEVEAAAELVTAESDYRYLDAAVPERACLDVRHGLMLAREPVRGGTEGPLTWT